MNQIIEALKKLDPSNPNHWTIDGDPRLDTVRMLAGDQKLTREHIVAVAPDFNVKSAAVWAPNPEAVANAAIAVQTAAIATASVNTQVQATTQQPAAEVPAPVESVDEKAVRVSAEIKQIELDLTDLRNQREILNAKIDNLLKKQDAFKVEYDHLFPRDHKSNMGDIQDYLESQKRKLEERGIKKAIIRESGIDLKALQKDLASPLDSAMARKTSRGAQRPTL